MSLDSKWWCTSIVGEITDVPSPSDRGAMNIDSGGKWEGAQLVKDLCHPTDASIRRNAEHVFKSSLAWAIHMNIPAVIVPPVPLDATESLNYARVLSGLTLNCSVGNVQLWVRTPFHAEYLEAFNLLCQRCDIPSNLGCMVCYGMDIPENKNASLTDTSQSSSPLHISSINLLHKFIGHSLKAVSFNTASFLTNKRGYPTLSKSYQLLFSELLRRIGRTCRVLVEGGCRHHPPNAPDANGQTGCLAYLQYLRHLRTRPEVTGIIDSAESITETPYLDHLQSPLQPLGDNLEFSTYETFEKDPVKYRNYQVAVELCLRDKSLRLLKNKNALQPNSSLPFEPLTVEEKIKFGNGFTHLVTILVVGAGRGPLIRASLAAVEAINRQQHQSVPQSMQPSILLKAHVIAIEKNPSAVLYLKSLCNSEEHWDEDTVTIIDCDMRNANLHPMIQHIRRRRDQAKSQIPTVQISGDTEGIADIIVSELLGSFGDNELSPECLDGAQRSGLLKEDCVSIPQEYTSYLAPVSSFRLHAEARAQAYSPSSPTDGPEGQPCGSLKALETPYVVRAHAASQTNKEKECFTFSHPKTFDNSMNPDILSTAALARACGIPRPSKTILAAMEVDNDRYKVVEFPFDPTYGAGSGCGYGSFDTAVAAMAQTAPGINNVGQATNLNTPIGTSIHGFFGTFEAVLYRSEVGNMASTISIVPSSFSEGMFSWFPIYFPLRNPLFVPVGHTLRCAFWRKTDCDATFSGGRVWYEWCCEVIRKDGKGHTNENGKPNDGKEEVVAASAVHNPNGRSYYVRL